MAPPSVAVVLRNRSLRPLVAQAFDHAPADWRVGFHEEVPPGADAVVVDDGRPGAVTFQAERSERLVEDIQARLAAGRAPAAARVIAVTGMPGSGVTSVALHLAATWAARLATCFLDLDVTWGCSHRLGLNDGVLTWGAAESSSPGSLPSVPLAPGLRGLIAPRHPPEVTPLAVVERARCEFSRVVIDAPYPGYGRELISPADAVVVVMAPCIPHAHRVAQLVAELNLERVVIVTNRLGGGGETTRTQLEAILEIKVGLELPCWPALRDAEGEQRLASLRWSRWGMALRRLSRSLDAA